MENAKCLEWFEKVDNGYNTGLPFDVGPDVQEAINLSFTITSMASVHSSMLIDAVKNDNYTEINNKLHCSSNILKKFSDCNKHIFNRIIEWANDHNLPQLSKFNATVYKQMGVPRNIHDLINLRFLLVNEDYGITEIPIEIAKLPLLQGLCITNNKIATIPTELYQCISLQRLDLDDNQISRVEDGIHKLMYTHTIDLSGNRLNHITPDISRMQLLKKLDIRNQNTKIDIMRADDTPLSDESLVAMYKLVERINVKY